jgi:hypothetical protein
MSCVLRVTGKDLNIDDVLSINLKTDSFWKKGQPKSSVKSDGEKHKNSGVTYLTSNAEFENFELQVKESINYLAENVDKIKSILSFPDIDFAVLDFGIVWRDVAIQSDYFPPDLVKIAGELGLGIELSQYPPSNSDE